MFVVKWRTLCAVIIGIGGFYFTLLGLLATVPALQTHVFYLHRLSLIWFKDLTIPEQFGFATQQVHSFFIDTDHNTRLHAWHVLPLGVYRRNVNILLSSTRDPDVAEPLSLALDLFKSDPDACLVLYFHGTAGCIASGWRPDSYRAISAGAPDHIHVLAFDYGGYGLSSGKPSENNVLQDAISVVHWALVDAKIAPERILIYGQSLGTAVALALMQHYASLPQPINFAGSVLTAPFSDVATLTSTYRIGGIIPVLSPLASAPPLLNFFTSFLTNTWMSKDRVVEYIRLRQSKTEGLPYYIHFIHAEDDSDIACEHSNVLYWHAVNATSTSPLTYEEVAERKLASRQDLGNGGWRTEHRTEHGLLIQQMLAYGTHDKLMSYATTSLAILEAFQAADSKFMS